MPMALKILCILESPQEFLKKSMTLTSCLDILIYKVQGKAQRAVFLILRWFRYTPKFENPWSVFGIGLSLQRT